MLFTELPKGQELEKAKVRAIRNQLIKLKGGRCSRCGSIARRFYFIHQPSGTKNFLLSGANLMSQRWDLVITEANQCDLLCGSCRRKPSR